MKEEIIINTQLALFFSQSIQRPDELWQVFNSSMGNIFDQVPVTLPVPDEPQLREIPLVQAVSVNGIHACKIARGRVDYFHFGDGNQKFSDIKNDFLKEIKNYFDFFSSKVVIKRIGFVCRFFIEDRDHSKTIAKLLDKKFKDLHQGNAHQAYARYVSRFEKDNFKLNNYTTVEKTSATISGAGSGINGILITRDFNTIPEEDYSNKLNPENIKKFIENGESNFKLSEIKKILYDEKATQNHN